MSKSGQRGYSMGYVYNDVDKLENKPRKGNDQCVTLIKVVIPELSRRTTSTWHQGEQVLDNTNIAKGTAIATFDEQGVYPNRPSGNHAALYLGQNASGTLIMEQWTKELKIHKKRVRVNLDERVPMTRRAATYYVIE
ncbi:BPSL0067 family protein [Salmonella enterica subsp. enterica]|uniref:BPSL0067 family protein n=1 Tax=Salmonella enterica TaxID=28901 RepID=UPI0021D51264|nr:BPSL0067 family protein [Salmonella enterica]EDS5972588.1 BPSL0067 family protein [Salmonella enterica subsp. enterica]EED9683309.1 BPSL0067 family protein [Salmonella enterica subsp. enterica]EHG2633081.1 BPSL0067 family protein [Salmonella enterica]